jgi:hypothetical protein
MSQNQRSSLTAALRALAESDAASMAASLLVEARLREQVRSIGRSRRQRIYATAACLAAASILAIALPQWIDAPPAPMPSSDQTSAAEIALPTEMATAFFPLAYSAAGTTTGQIVRLEVPRAALASFGLAPRDVGETEEPGTVLADVFVSDDGLARAVRFVRVQRQ